MKVWHKASRILGTPPFLSLYHSDASFVPAGNPLSPDSHFSFDSANHRVASDAFIYAGWKALKALRRSTPNG